MMLLDLRFASPVQFGRQWPFWLLTVLVLTLAGCRQAMVIKEIPYTNDDIATAPSNTHPDFETKLQNLENTMPGPHTNTYRIPRLVDQQAFQALVKAVLQHDLPNAKQLANTVNYELLDLTDSASADAESYVLQETATPFQGWGMYFFRVLPASNIVIEAPHPITDENTVNVALHLYRSLHAKALLIAGARRDTNNDDSADVAHASESIFQTVHQTLFAENGQPDTTIIFLQIHGYAAEDHPTLPAVVIGYNWQNDPAKDALLNRIVSAMEANHLTVGTCHERDYSGVCGTTNIQRQVTNGGIFLHLELSAALRAHDAALVQALQIALGQQ